MSKWPDRAETLLQWVEHAKLFSEFFSWVKENWASFSFVGGALLGCWAFMMQQPPYVALTIFLVATAAILAAIYFCARLYEFAKTTRERAELARKDFILGNGVYVESRVVEWEGGSQPGFYENYFYLMVGNNRPDAKTLRRVQARLFLFGPPILLAIKGEGRGALDLRQGEWAFFEVGRLVSEKMLGPIHVPNRKICEAAKRDAYSHNVSNDHNIFELYSFDGEPGPSIGFIKDQKEPFRVVVIVSADDSRAFQVRVAIDMQNEKIVSFEAIA